MIPLYKTLKYVAFWFKIYCLRDLVALFFFLSILIFCSQLQLTGNFCQFTSKWVLKYQYRSYIKHLPFNPLTLVISICMFSNIFRWICFPQSKPIISHLHISRTDHAGFHYATFIKNYICSSFGNNVSTQTRDLLQLSNAMQIGHLSNGFKILYWIYVSGVVLYFWAPSI